MNIYDEEHLLSLAESGSLTEVSSAMAAFGSYRHGWTSETPLCAAARQNPDPAVYAFLLELGFPLSARSTNGWTVLHELARRGWSRELIATVGKGAYVDEVTEQGTTALMLAAEKGKEESVKALLSCGADVRLETREGRTCLHGASASTIDILVDAGADLKAACKLGRTALHSAAARDNHECSRILVERGADIEAMCASGDTPLLIAARRGNLAAFLSLLHMGAQADRTDGNFMELPEICASNRAIGAALSSFRATQAMQSVIGTPYL